MDLIHVDPLLLAKWNLSVPRYTSYPTAPQFYPLGELQVKERLSRFDLSDKPLSLYFHIPFCKTMCLFCGCSVVLNRSPERQKNYLSHLLKEIELVARHFSSQRKVSQIHLGGGTPTSLTEEEFDQLMETIRHHFFLEEEAEISIEIDPRTVFADGGKKLAHLKHLGFNRVSFGVQDLDPKVQEAVKRRQSEEMTLVTYEKARQLGFQGINLDLIYGLPHQTVQTFAKTVEKILSWKPDRIAFYSYAKVPWLKAHQKAIDDAWLPTTEEKFQIYVTARQQFMEGGYVAIGMDHFGLPQDSISKAYREGKLTRNFQGYSVEKAEDMIGFGLTAIGYLEGAYFQNKKNLEEYQSSLSRGELPVERGYLLSQEDLRRRDAIQSLMCHFELDKKFEELRPLIAEGLVEETETKFVATPLGRLLIRVVASKLDSYLHKGQFSRAV